MIKAVLYARVSSKEQEKEGFSIPAQIKLLKEYAKKNDIRIAKEFVDVETAKKSGRVSFGEMVNFLRTNSNTNIILVEKTDRLYRNFKDYVLLEELEVEIHLVKENEIIGKDSRSHAKFIHGIKLLMAKNYIDNLSEESRKGMLEKAEQGDYPSRAPLGYTNNKITRRIEIDHDKADLVKRLFEWYATGNYSLKSLSDKVYKEGLGYIKSGARFSPGTMEKILKNHIYYGYFRWDKKIYKGNHTPIISMELFDKVQYQLKRFDKPRQNKHDFAYRGLLTCGYCGCKMTAELQKKRYVYYKCSQSKGKCQQGYFREEVIEDQLFKIVDAISLNPVLVEWLKSALKESHQDEQNYHNSSVVILQTELSKLENRVAKIYEDKLDGILTEDQWKSFHDKYFGKIEQIRNKIGLHASANIDYYEKGVKILELAQDAMNVYLRSDSHEKRRILDYISSNCVIKDGEFNIEYRQPFDMLAAFKEKEHKKIRQSGLESPNHQLWRPQGDSNPCCRRERAVS